MRPLVTQDIARVAVAVQSDLSDVAGAPETAAHLREHLAHEAFVGRQQLGWNEVALEQERERFVTERLHVERRSVLEGPQRTDRMDTPDEAAHPFERVALIELGCAATLACRHREQEAAM